MPKRVFIVHRWGANHDNDWYPWLKRMLEARDVRVIVPGMPNTDEPRISAWVPCLSEAVGNADKDTYFVGHSVGCQTILRYLETLDGNQNVGGAVFVAGWFHLVGLDREEEKVIREWLETHIDIKKAKARLGRSVAIFSDNDPYVPVSESEIFEEALGSRAIIHPNRGHFTSGDGVLELHVVLNEILKLIK